MVPPESVIERWVSLFDKIYSVVNVNPVSVYVSSNLLFCGSHVPILNVLKIKHTLGRKSYV